jgi:hypothetical protein
MESLQFLMYTDIVVECNKASSAANRGAQLWDGSAYPVLLGKEL